MKLFLLFCVVIFLCFKNCFSNSDCLETTLKVNKFINKNIEYRIYNLKLTWMEADLMCKQCKDGSLAILKNMDQFFLAEALSETEIILENLWIGAQKRDHQLFHWLDGTPFITNNFFVITRDNKDDNHNQLRECLAFQRKNHDIPLYVDLNCQLQRPYICQKPYIPKPSNITNSNVLIMENKEYQIIYSESTWNEALVTCIQKGQRLASFENIEHINFISRYMLIGRPSINNVWISGYYNNSNWVYLPTGNIIPNIKDPITSYPPWRYDRSIKPNGCLLLDIHLGKANFIEANCRRKRYFICEKIKYPKYKIDYKLIDNIGYFLYYEPLKWTEAFQKCEKINGTIAKITSDIMQKIIYFMGENNKEIQHVWIGGYLNSNLKYFNWMKDGEIIPNDKDIINNYPPWVDTNFEEKYSCLNMDRVNHNEPLFYGTICNAPQSFICEKNLECYTDNVKTEIIKMIQNNEYNQHSHIKECKTSPNKMKLNDTFWHKEIYYKNIEDIYIKNVLINSV